MKEYFYILFVVLSLHGCGMADCGDAKFSPASIAFDAQGGTVTTIASNVNWWLSNAMWIDSQPFGFDGCDSVVYKSTEVIYLEYQWFIVRKSNDKTLIISVQPNTTGKERKLSIDIQKGDCGTSIFVTQAAE